MYKKQMSKGKPESALKTEPLHVTMHDKKDRDPALAEAPVLLYQR